MQMKYSGPSLSIKHHRERKEGAVEVGNNGNLFQQSHAAQEVESLRSVFYPRFSRLKRSGWNIRPLPERNFFFENGRS